MLFWMIYSMPSFLTAPCSCKSNILARLCALHHCLNDSQHISRLARLNRYIFFLPTSHSLGKLRVESRICLGLQIRRRHLTGLVTLVHDGQLHRLGLVLAEPLVAGLHARLELVLLPVERVLAEAALVAADPEPGLDGLGAENADAHIDNLGVRVEELDGDIVRVVKVGPGLALVEELGVDGLREAKEDVDLVEEVGAQVEEVAAALGDAGVGLPVGRPGRAIPVKVGVELEDAAERVLLDEVLDCQKVRVPAAVLVHADETPRALRHSDELVGLGGGGDKGLFGQDVLAGFEGGLCELKVVGGRGADDDNVDVRVGEEVLGAGVVLEVRVVGRGRVALLGAALDDAVEAELGRRGDEGDVEDFGG